MLTQIVGKLPLDLSAHSPAAQLDVELMREKASALGRLGRNLEGALRALADFDAAHSHVAVTPQNRQLRSALVAAAAHMLWQLIVQREAIGLRDSRAVLVDYRVPAEVQRRMGAGRAVARD